LVLSGTQSKLYVVGVGPGAPDLVTRRALRLIGDADHVFGFQAALNVVGDTIRGARHTVSYGNQDDALADLVRLLEVGRTCVLCVYGDTAVSERQLLDRLYSLGVEVEFVPGISCVQAACARLGLQLDESVVVSFHRRGQIDLQKHELVGQVVAGIRHTIVLPRPWDFMPADIALFLASKGVNGEKHVTVLEDLTLPTESTETYTLNALASCKKAFSDLTIMVFVADKRAGGAVGP
jgi:precorrin-6y C5,15-methyltransferase (decarboxylating) CbiE subunit